MSTNLTISAKILENWSIPAIRHAFPAQLRPRRGKRLHPSFAVVLLNLSTISQGQVETIRKALRDAVIERCAQRKDLSAPAVTIEDVHHVYQRLCHVQGSENKRQKRDMYGMRGLRGLRRSKKVTFDNQAHGENESVGETESDTESISTTSAWPGTQQYATSKSITIPETPARRLSHNDVFESTLTDSYTVFSESSLRASGQNVSANDAEVWNEVQHQQRETAPEHRKAVLEAEIHSLLEQESEYIRLAEEQRAKAEQHQQEALEIRKKIDEVDAELRG